MNIIGYCFVWYTVGIWLNSVVHINVHVCVQKFLSYFTVQLLKCLKCAQKMSMICYFGFGLCDTEMWNVIMCCVPVTHRISVLPQFIAFNNWIWQIVSGMCSGSLETIIYWLQYLTYLGLDWLCYISMHKELCQYVGLCTNTSA